jgi:hypothetical protein
MLECPKVVSIAEHTKLGVEHRGNASKSKEKTSKEDVVKITGRSCRAFVQDEQEKDVAHEGGFQEQF